MSIIEQLEPMDTMVRNGLLGIRGQLDRLCALGRTGPARIDIPGRN
jgi:hypothetical protein